ncbi:MAG: hypothetical protein QM770_19900 [Tepidisphaeraceae bacterium]
MIDAGAVTRFALHFGAVKAPTSDSLLAPIALWTALQAGVMSLVLVGLRDRALPEWLMVGQLGGLSIFLPLLLRNIQRVGVVVVTAIPFSAGAMALADNPPAQGAMAVSWVAGWALVLGALSTTLAQRAVLRAVLHVVAITFIPLYLLFAYLAEEFGTGSSSLLSSLRSEWSSLLNPTAAKCLILGGMVALAGLLYGTDALLWLRRRRLM